MQRIPQILLAFFFLLLFCGYASAQQSGILEYEVCKRDGGDGNRRLFACSKIVADSSQPAEIRSEALRNRASAYASKGDFDRAEIDYQEADKLEPKDANFYTGMVMKELWDEADFAAGIAACGHAIKLDAKAWAAYICRGYSHFGRGDFDPAIADFTSAISIAPQNSEGYSGRGWVYIFKDEPTLSMADCTRVIEIDAKKSSGIGVGLGHDCRAGVYWKLGKYDDALAESNRAVETNPESSAVFETRALIYEARGSKDEAHQDFQTALSKDGYINWLRKSATSKFARDAMERLGMRY